MREVLAAVHEKIRTDATIMARLNNRGPFYGRLPEDAVFGKDQGAITMEAEAVVDPGATESQIVTLHVWTYRKMLGEDISKDIDRLFHSYRYRWQPLSLGAAPAAAYARVEFRHDVTDPSSELYHKVLRLRIRYVHGPAPG